MKTATVADAESHLSTLIDAVEAGEQVVILRRGRPIVRLVPEPASPDPWEAVHAWVGSGPALAGNSVADLRERELL
jgi:prevent-host-death family protein